MERMMLIESKYNIGQIIFLKTDPEQKERMLTQISITSEGMRYCLSCGTSDSWHYEIEILAERDVLKSVGVEAKGSS
jgi:hypothetical protein